MSFISLDILLNKNKIIPFYQERHRDNFKNMMPISAEIHWTSNCNYDCVHCSYGSRRGTKGYLSREVIDFLINDLIEMNCQAVYFSGGGEPTVMSRWDQYASKLIENEIEVALITNGVAIKRNSLSVVRKMNYIAVSVYSTYEDRYKKITDSRFFNEQFTLPEKVKGNSSSVIVGARCVLNKYNFDEVYDIYNTAISSGFDYIIFIPAVDYEGRGVILEEKCIEYIKNNIQTHYELFDHSRTNVASILKRNISYYNKNNYLASFIKPLEGCEAIHMRSGVFINYDGGVYLCQPDIGDKDLEIGNLNDCTMREIWNSDQHYKVIEVLNERWNKGFCDNCRSIVFNQAIYNYHQDEVIDKNIVLDPFL